MDFFFGLYQKREDIKSNAFWSKLGIYRNPKVDKGCIENYKKHLADCETCPTVGLLARRKYITGKKVNYSKYAQKNINYLERQPGVDVLRKKVDGKLQELYPKTKYARLFIIDENRVVLDEIKPVKKYGLIDRIKLIKRFFKNVHY